MNTLHKRSVSMVGFLTLLLSFLLSGSLLALEGAHDRNGGFVGLGLGGGVGVGSAGQLMGDGGLDLQLGLGVGQRITVALDVESNVVMTNPGVMGFIIPGPAVSIFLLKNLYLRGKIGAVIAVDDQFDKGSAAGLRVGAGLGLERFVNTNLAGFLEVGGDYYLLDDHNNTSHQALFNFWMGIRYY